MDGFHQSDGTKRKTFGRLHVLMTMEFQTFDGLRYLEMSGNGRPPLPQGLRCTAGLMKMRQYQTMIFAFALCNSALVV